MDLSQAVAISLLWRLPDGTTREVELVEAEDGDLELGKVQREWVAGDTDVLGAHRGQVAVTWPDTDDFLDFPSCFPTDGAEIVWFVNRRIGG